MTCSCLRAANTGSASRSAVDMLGHTRAEVWEMLREQNPHLNPQKAEHLEPLRQAYIALTNKLFQARNNLAPPARCGICFLGFLSEFNSPKSPDHIRDNHRACGASLAVA